MFNALNTGDDIEITFTETLIKTVPEKIRSLNGQYEVQIELNGQEEKDFYNIVLTGKVGNVLKLKKHIQGEASDWR